VGLQQELYRVAEAPVTHIESEQCVTTADTHRADVAYGDADASP